jgi:uncharacterized repeat protein (TIGR01451 family)
VTVGGEVTFEIDITNHSQAPVTGLVLKDRFEAGLERPDHPSPIQKRLSPLAPGETQRIGLPFRAVRAGRLCHTVEILGGESVLATAEGCVVAVEGAPGAGPAMPSSSAPAEQSALSVKSNGPPQGTVGQEIDFFITLTNTGTQELTNLKVTSHSDAALKPRQASEGYKQLQNGDLVWTFASLPAGQKIELGVKSRCLQAASQACNRVAVSSQEGIGGSAEACVDVRETRPAAAATPSNLSLTVTGLHNPIYAGKELTYEIRVKNSGPTPDRQVTVKATVPVNMVLNRLGTGGPTGYEYENQVLRFAPLAQINADETVTYRIRVRARQAGRFHFEVELSSQGLPQPRHAEEATDVELPPRNP